MRTFSMMFFLWAALPTFVLAHPWSGHVGCYKTLSVNGSRVSWPRGIEPSTIQERDSLRYFLGMDRGDLAGIDFKIFIKQDSSSRYHYHALFFDAGQMENQSYTFEGMVRLRPMPEEILEIKRTLTLRPLVGQQLELTVKDFSSAEDVYVTYRLQRIRCVL